MYQINYLPWRHALLRKKIHTWFYLSLLLIAITLLLCGYYTYYLAQIRYLITDKNIQIQQQETILIDEIAVYQNEKQRIDLRYRNYQYYYQNWLHHLRHIHFFQSLEKHLPLTAWISHYSEVDTLRSLHLMLPNERSLSFISHIENHPFFASVTLHHLQQSRTYPSYTEVYFEGSWDNANQWRDNKETQ